MKRMLENLINKLQKEEIELMFGYGSKVVINSINYSTNRKEFVIHTTLFATFNNEDCLNESELSLHIDMFPTGLNMLIRDSWKFMGIDTPIILVNKLEVF